MQDSATSAKQEMNWMIEDDYCCDKLAAHVKFAHDRNRDGIINQDDCCIMTALDVCPWCGEVWPDGVFT